MPSDCKTIRIIIDTCIALTITLIIIIIFKNSNLFKRIIENFVPEKCQEDSYLVVIKNKIQQLFNHKKGKWSGHLSSLNNKKSDILETLKFCKGESSYTINKSTVYICMYDEHEQMYDENMLMHVMLHELSHAICTSVGHNTEFDDIFKELMDEAHEFNIYDKNKPLPDNYCGTSKDDTYIVENNEF